MGRPKDETFWEHVLKEDGGRRCEFCGKRWNGKPSISRLKSHFAGARNQGIEICEYVPEHVQRAALDAINVSETVKEAALQEIQRKIHERRNKKISSSTTLEDNQITLVHPNNELANQENDRLMAMGNTIIHEDCMDIRASTLPDVPNENNVRESVQVIETAGDKLITTELVGIQFEIDCRKIQDWLLDDEVSMIGIHGMPGAGKTELAKHINNNLINASKFHHVCWVTVSPNFSIYKLQDTIAKAVGGLDLSNVHDENIRAARLSKALEKGKKRYAIILDDVWDYIPLKGIGIFAGIETCKLILTTCLLDVCDKMQCQKIIEVQRLTRDEAGYLIHREIRDELPESTIIQLIKISEGLPLGIVMMMRNIRGKVKAYEQKIVLDNWKGGTLSPESKEVFSRLRRCYDKLDPTLQQCFLYCALFSNWRIKESKLISYLIDEGIINRKESRKKEFEEGYYMLGRLKNCCLLRRGNYIKMHTLFICMILKMNESSMAVVRDGRELTSLLEEERCPVDIKRISVLGDYMREIPRNYSLSCPNLLTLLLCGMLSLESIPSSFFMNLQGLKLLDLSYNSGIKELPDSISHLMCLTALLLRCCRRLTKVPSLTKLKALRKLDLSYSGIEEVPKGLELLSKLKYLGLMDTKLEVLPLEILDKLCCLEVLIINYHFLRINAKEIANLRMLETLICRCDNYDEFVAFLEGIRLLQCRYQLYVSRHLYHEESFLDEEYLSFDKRVAIYAHATFYPKEWFDKVQWVHPSTHSLLSSISRFHYLEDDEIEDSDNDSYF